jgi:hypothetical protein
MSVKTLEIKVARLRFAREQDGVPEQKLKQSFIRFLSHSGMAKTAYLAVVEYPELSRRVSLCVRTEPNCDPKRLVEDLGQLFVGNFGTREQLDIIFITADQESELKVVCNPFFTRNK